MEINRFNALINYTANERIIKIYAINSEILSGNSMHKHFKFGPLNDP